MFNDTIWPLGMLFIFALFCYALFVEARRNMRDISEQEARESEAL